VYRHVLAVTRTKLDPPEKRCRMIGYAEDSGSHVYRLYDEEAEQVLVSRDVIFNEDVTGTGSQMAPNTNSRTNEKTVRESMVELELESATGTGTNTTLPPQPNPNKGDSAELLPPIDPEEGESTGQATIARLL